MSNFLKFLLFISVIRFLKRGVKQKINASLNILLNIIISFLASCTYVLSLKQSIKYYKKPLKNLPILQNFIPIFIQNKKYKNNIKNLNLNLLKILSYRYFFYLFCLYFIVIRKGKMSKKIDYFIKYNLICSILISLIQLPITFIYKELNTITTLNPLFKEFTHKLAICLVLLQFIIQFYAIFYAIRHKYVHLPFLKGACEGHIGKKPYFKYKNI